MTAELLVLIVLPILLVLAAGWDVASYTIPNFLQLALIASFAVFIVATGMAPATITPRLAVRQHKTFREHAFDNALRSVLLTTIF